MALSFRSVEKAYEIFNDLKQQGIIDLRIPSWPDDMQEWDEDKKKYPPENTVLGFSKKADDGWENLVFFVRDPSDKLKAAFDEWKKKVPNSSMSEVYSDNPELWIFGWF